VLSIIKYAAFSGKQERKKKKRNTKDSHGGMKNIIIGRVVHGIN